MEESKGMKNKERKKRMLERFPILFFTFSLLPFLLSNCNNFFHDLVPPDDNRIESFSVDGQVSVEIGENTITAYVSSGTNLKELIPSISVSKGATLFPVTYEYVSRAFGDDRTFGAAMQLYTGGVDKLVDLIRANKDSFAVPVLDLPINFGYPVDFLVISALGTIRQYKVRVEIDTGEGKFKSFKFDKFYNPEIVRATTGVVDTDNKTVTVNVSYPVEYIALYQLTPTFETNGARVYLDGAEWKSNETLVDFEKPPDSLDLVNNIYSLTKTLTLKRAGYDDVVWTLIVNFSEDPDTNRSIIDFRFTKALNPLINADYMAEEIYVYGSGNYGEIYVTVYYNGEKPEELRASFISPGTVTVNGDLQISGYSTQSAQDFSNELQYIVTSKVGGFVRTYYVWVDFISAADPLPQITTFSFRTEQNPSLVSSSTAIIDHNARLILIEAAFDGDTPPYDLIPQFTATGGTVTVNDIRQYSGNNNSLQNFSSPVGYVVTNSSNPTLKREYRVEVRFVHNFSSAAEITTFSFYQADNPGLLADVHATVNQATGAISATLYFDNNSDPSGASGGDRTLIPRWTAQGRIELNGVAQTSGELEWQFYTPQPFRAVSIDGLFQKNYTVTVREYNSRIYVKHDAAGRNDGTNWENAYRNLSSATSAANSFNYPELMKEVWIAEGTYVVSSTLQPKINTSFIGGFIGNEAKVSARVDPASHRPVITGDQGEGQWTGRLFRVSTYPISVSGVWIFEDLLPTCADMNDVNLYGAGLYATFFMEPNRDPDPIDVTLILKGVEFREFRAGYGGAVYIHGSYRSNIPNTTNCNVIMTDCSFINIQAYNGGGACEVSQCETVTINNCRFTNTMTTNANVTNWGGGALEFYRNESVTVTNCAFTNTSAANNRGNAIFFSDNTNVTLDGNIFNNVPEPRVYYYY